MVSLEGKGIAGHLDRKDFQIRAQREQLYADFRQQPSDIAAAFSFERFERTQRYADFRQPSDITAAFSVLFYCCSIKVQ